MGCMMASWPSALRRGSPKRELCPIDSLHDRERTFILMTAPSIPFPGRVIGIGSGDSASILAIQKRRNQFGCGPVPENGVFDASALEAVELFQARSLDS